MSATPLTASADPARELAALLPPEAIERDPARIAPHLVDNRGRFHGRALALTLPSTTEEVSRLLAWCNARGIGVVPQGGNTGNSGGATPDGSGAQLLLGLERMNRIRHVDAEDFSLCAEAGCTLAAVQSAADSAHRHYPLSLGSSGTCQIGGTLATNAGGLNVLRFGMARELSLGLEVVLPDGRVLDLGRSLRKDNTGYDLKSLFIGSEGTLGVITAATLKLFPAVASSASVWVALRGLRDEPALLELMQSRGGEFLTRFELLPASALRLLQQQFAGVRLPLGAEAGWQALIEWTSPGREALDSALQGAVAEAMQRGLVSDAALAIDIRQAEDFWTWRESISEAQRRNGPSLKHDISVPIALLPEFLEQVADLVARELPQGELVAYGHAGDGNLHCNVGLKPGGDAALFAARSPGLSRQVHDLVMQFGGSISAEHGIGRLKAAEFAERAGLVRMAALRAVKGALDPKGIMNPGVLFA